MASQRKTILGFFVLFLTASFFLSAAADPIMLPITVMVPANPQQNLPHCVGLLNNICCVNPADTIKMSLCSMAFMCTPHC